MEVGGGAAESWHNAARRSRALSCWSRSARMFGCGAFLPAVRAEIIYSLPPVIDAPRLYACRKPQWGACTRSTMHNSAPVENNG